MSDNNTIKGQYFNRPDLVPDSISGASIAISPTGKVIMGFFTEVPLPPKSFEIIIDENNAVVEQRIDVEENYQLARYNRFFAEMDVLTARNIAELILAQLDEMEAQNDNNSYN